MTVDFDRLSLVNVSRHFGRRPALSRVSLTCRAGETVGLIGPNGAGKSTLLSILATLLAPSAGEVRYGDFQARDMGPALRRRIGLLAHELHLYADLSARENLEFFARLYGVSNAAARAGAALGRAGLTERADDPVSSFSRGMRQRLALERAVLHDPRLLLLDEPFTGLDAASAHALVARLRDLRNAGCLIVMATHDLESAEGVLDTVAFLNEGRLAVDGAAGPLRERYRAYLNRR